MRIKSAEKIAALKAVFTQLKTTTTSSTSATAGIFQVDKLSFSVSTLNRILSEAEAGNFVYFAKYFDTYYIRDGARPSDQLTFSFEKFFDSVETASVAEAHFADIGKGLADSVSIADADTVQKDFARFLYDTPAALESIAKHITKAPFVDDGYITDDDTVQFGKVSADEFVTADEHALDVGKPLENAFAASEVYFAAVGKPFTNTFSAIDESEFAYSKGATDTLALTDNDFIDVGKALEDTPSLTDAHFYDYGLQGNASVYFAEDYVDTSYSLALDILTILDQPNLTAGKVVADSASIAEVFARQVDYSRAFNDPVNATDDVDGSASILDDQEMQYVKFLTETSNITDDFARQVNYIREFANAGSAADTFDKVVAYVRTFSGADNTASTTDANHLAITKNEADAAHLADLRFSVVSKARSDTASTTDEGLILTQSYAGFYFSEDFVGSSTTF